MFDFAAGRMRAFFRFGMTDGVAKGGREVYVSSRTREVHAVF